MSNKILLIITLIIISLIISIIIIRTFLYFFLVSVDFVSKKFKKTNITTYNKEEEELLRDKNKEKKQEKNIIKNQQQLNTIEKYEPEPEKIVGFTNPIGFWTSFVIGKNLINLIQQKGLWTEKIKNKERQMQRNRQRNI